MCMCMFCILIINGLMSIVCKESFFSTILPDFIDVCLFSGINPNQCHLKYCVFYLSFPDAWWCWEPFHVVARYLHSSFWGMSTYIFYVLFDRLISPCSYESIIFGFTRILGFNSLLNSGFVNIFCHLTGCLSTLLMLPLLCRSSLVRCSNGDLFMWFSCLWLLCHIQTLEPRIQPESFHYTFPQ